MRESYFFVFKKLKKQHHMMFSVRNTFKSNTRLRFDFKL